MQTAKDPYYEALSSPGRSASPSFCSGSVTRPPRPCPARSSNSSASLQSSASPAEKDAACARLKRIGTDLSVPALAALLSDEQLSHSARYALESMPSRKAGQALIAALSKASGLTKVGIINSLGMRSEKRAVPALGKLLADKDEQRGSGRRNCLGPDRRHEGPQSVAEGVQPSRPGRCTMLLRTPGCAAPIACWQPGAESKARGIFQALYEADKSDTYRTAAYRGMILSSGKRALHLMTTAILGTDKASQTCCASVGARGECTQCDHDLCRPAAPGQSARSSCLARGSHPARGCLRGLDHCCDGQEPSIGSAPGSHQALGILGDDTMIPLLGVAATSVNSDEQKAARLALVQLRRGNPTETLLRLLPNAKPEVQAEFARALGGRSDKTAVPRLVELAREGAGSARKAALQALALLVEDPQLGMMVQFVADAKTEARPCRRRRGP